MIITNGSLLNSEKLKLFGDNLDWITLPLDGSNEENQILVGRPPGHFSQVIKLLDQLKTGNYKLKINTVLCKQNFKDIENIAQLIKKYKIKRWKVFQFFPIRSASCAYKDKYEVSNHEFNQVKAKIKSLFKPDECSIHLASIKELENSYFCIDPNGIVYTTRRGKDYPLGDLKKQSGREIWENTTQFDKKAYWERTSWFIGSK